MASFANGAGKGRRWLTQTFASVSRERLRLKRLEILELSEGRIFSDELGLTNVDVRIYALERNKTRGQDMAKSQ